MLEHLWHWLARVQGNAGHIAFGEARCLYLSFLAENQTRFDQIDDDDFLKASQDPRLVRAERLFERAARCARQEGRSDNVAVAQYQRGMLLHLQGRLSEARGQLAMSADALLSSVSGDRSERATLSGCYYHLGILEMREGRPADAERLLRKSLEIDEADADLVGVRLCRSALETLASCSFPKKPGFRLPGPSANDGPSPPANQPASLLQTPPKDLPDQPAPPGRGPDVEDSARTRKEEAAAFEYSSPIDFPVSDVTDVIWLLSYSVEANDVFMKELEPQLVGFLSRRLRIQRAAFGSSDESRATLERIAPDEALCAAILILEEEALRDATFLRWAKLCVGLVTERDDFRLFVGSPVVGRPLEEARRWAQGIGRDLIESLFQTVQFDVRRGDDSVSPSSLAATPFVLPGPAEVGEACGTYLRNLSEIRSAAFWRKLRLMLVRFCGRVAWIGQAASAALLFLILVAVSLSAETSTLLQWIRSHGTTAALLVGIVLFPIHAVLASLILRGPQMMNILVRQRRELRRLLLVLFLLSAGLGFLVSRLELSSAWLWLGVGAGLLFDHARRVDVSLRRASVSLSNCLEAYNQPDLPNWLIAKGRRLAEHPLYVPLFPAVRPRIFLSYGRDRAWSEGVARRLHQMLTAQGTVSFLDETIGRGANWRAILNRSIAETDVFVSIVDEETLSRQWVAAELIAALAGRVRAGAPKIIILAAQRVEAVSHPKALPVFQALLNAPRGVGDSREPRVLNITDASLAVVASGLRQYHYETFAVIPGEWSLVLRWLTIPIVAIGVVSEWVGLPATVIFYLEYWNRTNIGAWLEESRLLAAACLLLGYLAGFNARLVTATAFEVERTHARGRTAKAIFGAGLAALAILWSRSLEPLFVGWMVVLGCLGWCLAVLFLVTIRGEKPSLFGPD